MCPKEGRKRRCVFTDRESERERLSGLVVSWRVEETKTEVGKERERIKRKMKIGGGRDSSSWEKDVCSEQSGGEERQTAKRIVCARRTEQKRVVRRRLVCGAFTGVGPSFILPLQSVNTYLRRVRCVCVLRVRMCVFDASRMYAYTYLYRCYVLCVSPYRRIVRGQ